MNRTFAFPKIRNPFAPLPVQRPPSPSNEEAPKEAPREEPKPKPEKEEDFDVDLENLEEDEVENDTLAFKMKNHRSVEDNMPLKKFIKAYKRDNVSPNSMASNRLDEGVFGGPGAVIKKVSTKDAHSSMSKKMPQTPSKEHHPSSEKNKEVNKNETKKNGQKKREDHEIPMLNRPISANMLKKMQEGDCIPSFQRDQSPLANMDFESQKSLFNQRNPKASEKNLDYHWPHPIKLDNIEIRKKSLEALGEENYLKKSQSPEIIAKKRIQARNDPIKMKSLEKRNSNSSSESNRVPRSILRQRSKGNSQERVSNSSKSSKKSVSFAKRKSIVTYNPNSYRFNKGHSLKKEDKEKSLETGSITKDKH